MVSVTGVKFKEGGKLYYFDPKDFDIKNDTYVIVQTARGMECGLSNGVSQVEDSEVVAPLKPVVRIATEDDIKRNSENKELEREAYTICLDKIEAHGLDMNLTDVEYSFDRSKILFNFTSDGRVDFRELVKDLASTFHARIELRQIGVRDEARKLGGIGICGRPFCCCTFLNEFHSVTIKMAKDQGLSLSPSKISGCCGRLMCCLKHEQNSYEELQKITPPRGAVVNTKEGKGVVVDSQIITGVLKVKLDKYADGAPVAFMRDEVMVVRKK